MRNALTAYEAEQFRLIEAWKAAAPQGLGTVCERFTSSAARGLGKALPRILVRKAIESVYTVGEWIADADHIRRRGGVADIRELRHADLVLCDVLTDGVQRRALEMATAEGVVTGMGGMGTIAVDMPALIVLALRTTHHMGYCYGFRAQSEADKHFILSLLLAAGATSDVDKQAALASVYAITRGKPWETWQAFGDKMVEDTIRQEGTVRAMKILAVQLVSKLTAHNALNVMPVVGAVTAAALNRWYMHEVCRTARHVFQERWLLANRKLPIRPVRMTHQPVAIWIPAPDVVATSGPREATAASARAATVTSVASSWLSKTVYTTCYYASYGAVFSSHLMTRTVSSGVSAKRAAPWHRAAGMA